MPVSDLRSRLRKIAAPVSAPIARRGSGLVTTKTVYPRLDALARLDARALSRMGADFPWPEEPSRVLFLDTETTGLAGGAGTIVFMLGLGYQTDEGFVVEQATLGDYPDERALLELLCARMQNANALVTFNGRAFDMKLLESRVTMARLRDGFPELAHLDLLAPARRLWKRRLGSVRLSVLEERVLRRGRHDDLPGSEAPERFFAYLKTGEEALLDEVKAHNKLDVVSLAHLLVQLNAAYKAPMQLSDADDLISAGKLLTKLGEREAAMGCFRMASAPVPATSLRALRTLRTRGEAQYHLSMLLKRGMDWDAAQALWRDIVSRDPTNVRVMLELAKSLEHRERAFREALVWTDRALAICPQDAQLVRRRARLLKKISNMEDRSI